MDIQRIGEILERAKLAAVDYYQLTGKPLGITGEIGEYYAAKYLGLELAEARTAGYDATDKSGRRIQIKARSIAKRNMKPGQRLGSIKLEHDWDAVILVIMDEKFQPQAMYEAGRAEIEEALTKPGSKARNERGALALSKFKSIGKHVWAKT